ncbi:Na/Pi cotransporter family protein [Alicyclobacillus macrosporangiidus]|uniref:Na/Pi cotransporter family protein n=1 Tax=Alicyclobacillus macrosporangiidus TaxID=392015 RepID=UPI001E407BA9|nr:Na/Pi symporter [Alicyclobacillus macrosporangiidus]
MFWNLAMAAAALFVFIGGLQVMRAGLEAMVDSRLPALLHQLARTPGRGILTGTVITAFVQSSAAITAAAVGLVAGGSLVFRDALGIVLGANVGSTITPQLLSLDLTAAAVVTLAIGTAGWMFGGPRVRQICRALTGFSCVFIALHVLELALQPVAQTVWFQKWLQGAAGNPVVALLTGCLASAVVQSSTVTTVIAMALAVDGVLPVPSGIAIVFGANVGTCVTSVIASIGQIRPAQQVALAHVLLNAGGALAFLPLLGPYSRLMAALAENPAQQIANAHTVFNVLCTLLVWPIAHPFARLVEWLLPDHRHA